MQTVRARAGRIIGRDHMARQVNCQDGYALVEDEAFVIGIVCDGCSEGQFSEVGAVLSARFLADQGARLLHAGTAITALPEHLYRSALSFLENLIKLMNPDDHEQFILDHLLFTVIGVAISNEQGVIFAVGDGTIAIDDNIHRRDENNLPNYIAYNLLDVPNAPPCFEVYPVPATWRCLGVASDGFEPELFPEIRGLSHPRGLQRRLNAWSNVEHRFRDDATVIAIEKVE